MNDWQYQPASDLEKPLLERLRTFPREPDMLVYGLRSMAALLLRGWLQLYHRLEIKGRENLPKEGSFIMVANHASHLDTLALLSALPIRKLHQTFPAAAQDYFFVTIPRIALSAIVVNAMPFARQVQSRQSLAACKALLERSGNVMILYPEGTRTTTGKMDLFRPGIGMLVAGCDIPVVPCGLQGMFQACPKGACFPRPAKLIVNVGKPLQFSGLPKTRESYEAIAARLHDAVEELL